ncbi:MAG: LysR substrate-binding domain-containing protein [Victivallales bacterium]|jgi:DNA-binding transcriptional LysR family regulator
MELTHLRYFIAVAEELHFGRAAAKLHIAQPPLSQQIKRLEDELEIKLFNRTSRRVELSAAGKIFLPEARGIVEQADKTLALMTGLSQGQSGYLAIAFNETAINTFLPAAIKKFTGRYPEVKLSLEESGIVEQFNALDEKRIHLGFMRPLGYDIEAYSKRLLLREEYVLALPAEHKLCAYSSLTLDMLRHEPLILLPQSRYKYLRDCFDKSFRRCGFEPDIVQELNSKHTTLALVKEGVGLALVPESNMVCSPGGVEFRKLNSDLPTVEIFALWRPENDSPLIKNFLDLIPDAIS